MLPRQPSKQDVDPRTDNVETRISNNIKSYLSNSEYMEAHPAISEVLQQNGHIDRRFRNNKKSELRICK